MICKIDGCKTKQYCKGLCYNHYHAWYIGRILNDGKPFKSSKVSHTGVRGVYRNAANNCYTAEVRKNGERRYIGSYKTIELAAKAKHKEEFRAKRLKKDLDG